MYFKINVFYTIINLIFGMESFEKTAIKKICVVEHNYQVQIPQEVELQVG